MIDSSQKRMSVFELPGLMTNPFPNGVNTAPDRQQMSDIYAGILANAPMSSNETCWRPSLNNASPWVNSKKTTNVWKSEKQQTKSWIPEQEMVPCQD